MAGSSTTVHVRAEADHAQQRPRRGGAQGSRGGVQVPAGLGKDGMRRGREDPLQLSSQSTRLLDNPAVRSIFS